MSSVAKGFSCFDEPAVAARVNCGPDLVHGGVWKPGGDVEAPRLEDTRLARSVDGGSISMHSVTSEAEVIFGFRMLLVVAIHLLPTSDGKRLSSTRVLAKLRTL